jgi:DNA-binding helix-hairpin-helix protein with protein kinase domain
LTTFAAWPLEVLSIGRPNEVAGVVLPRARNYEEIHKLYSPAQRKIEYPDKDWGFLLHAAMNCAAAFDTIHSRSHVIGDVNQGNVLVSRRGTVFLIDCDSFQVTAQGRVFFCEVGVPHYTPPELQGHGFRGLESTANQDRFGLALLIFHLLFMGRHPFAGRFQGRGDMPIERAIAEYRYAFSQAAAALAMAPPPQTLPLGQIAPQLAPLFEQAFDRGSEQPGARPTAEQWHAALADVVKQLQPCAADKGHTYVRGLAKCPWCQLILAGAPNFFLSVTFRGTTPEVLNVTPEIASLWSAIEQVGRPQGSSLPTAPAAALHAAPTPPPPAVESAQALSTMVGFVALASLVGMTAMLYMSETGYISVPMFAVFSLWWLALFATSGLWPERNRRRRIWRARRGQLKQLQSAWSSTIASADTRFRLVPKEMAAARGEIAKLERRYDVQRAQLARNMAERQREAFLQSKFICNYKIEGISAGRQATLTSYGIETAHDVDYNRVLAIPGMGPAMADSLCAWRGTVERQFTLNKAQGVPLAQRQALLLKYAQMRQQLEVQLRQGPERLHEIDTTMQQSLHQLAAQIAAAHLATAQAFADLSIMDKTKQSR